jgi:hypothetical protein
MPTLIKIYPDYYSQLNLRDYLNSNSIKKENQRDRFHSTLYYKSQTPLFNRKEIFSLISSALPIRTESEYSFDTFEDNGQEVLVLKYESEQIRKLNKDLVYSGIKQMINWDNISDSERELLEKSMESKPDIIYPEFNPHITLANNFKKEDLEKLIEFKEKILFDYFTWHNNY